MAGAEYHRAPTTSRTRGCWGRGAAAHPAPLQLFDFIAQCVHKFLEEIGSLQHCLPLGFVFPFSCRQTGLGKVSGAAGRGDRATPRLMANGSPPCSPQAELISWSKGFQCSDVEGKDVVQLLQAAINKLEVVGRLWGAG